jgi:hypothetical protein
VDDQCGRRALARGFLELIRPPPVIGHPLALEQGRILLVEAGVIDQHHHRLALDVDAGVVVPVLLGRIDAVSDEDKIAAIQPHLRPRRARAHDHVGAEFQLARLAGDIQLHRHVLVRAGFHHRHGLEIAVAVAGLEAQAPELRLDVGDGLLLARAARAATPNSSEARVRTWRAKSSAVMAALNEAPWSA